MAEITIALLTVSDRCSTGDSDDTSGRALRDACEERGWIVVAYHVCPDDHECITASLLDLTDVEEADVILTTGGTGLGPRDITPEATLQICERLAPGIAEAIRMHSAEITPRAMLGRGVAGVRGRTLIVNLPGSENAAMESFGFIADQLEHAVEMMAGGGH